MNKYLNHNLMFKIFGLTILISRIIVLINIIEHLIRNLTDYTNIQRFLEYFLINRDIDVDYQKIQI